MTEQVKLPKLSVVMAFDRDESGDLQTVIGPADQQSEDRAVRIAKGLLGREACRRSHIARLADVSLNRTGGE